MRSTTAQTLLALGTLHLLASTSPLHAQTVPSKPVPIEWYLPEDVTYDPAFPRPESVLGWTVGEWHVRHDQVLQWVRAVAVASPRVSLETYGHSHEQRELVLARITSPGNQAQLESLRAAHVDGVLGGSETIEGPEVIWLGYGVHGNEASATNAALLVLYHLAAATGPEIDAFFERTIVVLDPCINPDGNARFAEWANSHRGQQLVGDPNHREHREVWPGGRTNHYWFDLNRDWLLLTHPESRGRITAFQRWMPCVLTDYHEMGTDSTYFFQPGIPSRTNPLTPLRNLDLTRAIAQHHAAALDALGSLYFTEENFDDFYYGKGSTYPDILGCIGILFEQASARGHYQENSYGGISFPFTIRNQVATSLSTLRAADALRAELAAYQRESFKNAVVEAEADPLLGYVFGLGEDPARTRALAELVRHHGVAVHELGHEVTLAGETFRPGAAFTVPLAQPRARLVRALFETRTSWDDNTFYDVSSWTLPLSFGLPVRGVPRDDDAAATVFGVPWVATLTASGELQGAGATATEGRVAGASAPERANETLPAGWAFDWRDSRAPRALTGLLASGVRARVATEPFEALTVDGAMTFERGSIVVARGTQAISPSELKAALQSVAEAGVPVHPLTSGATPHGADLGSSAFAALTPPRPLLVVGDGVSAYESGEVWHELDVNLGLGVSMVERGRLDGLDLERYTHLLLVSGATDGWKSGLEESIRAWIQRGGVLVATRGAASRIARELLENAPAEPVITAPEKPAAYADYDDLRAVERIAGAIFEVELDLTHPLAFGLARRRLPVFRNATTRLPEGLDPFGTPARYSREPLLSGYASSGNVQRIAGTPALRAARLGRGCVICLADDPLFRGAWQGSRRLYVNALFMAGALARTGPLEGAGDESDDEAREQH